MNENRDASNQFKFSEELTTLICDYIRNQKIDRELFVVLPRICHIAAIIMFRNTFNAFKDGLITKEDYLTVIKTSSAPYYAMHKLKSTLPEMELDAANDLITEEFAKILREVDV